MRKFEIEFVDGSTAEGIYADQELAENTIGFDNADGVLIFPLHNIKSIMLSVEDDD